MATTVSLKPNAVEISGSTSGTTTLQASAVAGTTTLTLPAATDTLVGKATTDTLTNKTLTSPTLTSPVLGTPASGTLTNCTGLPVSTGLTGSITEANGGTGTTTGYYGFKNRIINGAMVIDQRNAGASGTATVVYTVDRWLYNASQASKGTWGQNYNSVTLPAGFSNYLGFQTASSSYSIGASDYFMFQQPIEGFNVADLSWGTASASSVTLSFKVYSSLTGTFGGTLSNSAQNRSYPFTYTISSANTWTTISITIAGDTSGTWLTTNGIGIYVRFGLGVGSTYSGTASAWAGATYLSATGATSVVGTANATFYITGVQLEKGSTATSFDYRPYGTELALCQRYYEKSYDIGTALGSVTVAGFAAAQAFNTTSGQQGVIARFNVEKRSSPTMSYWDGNGNASKVSTISSGGSWTSNITAGGFVDTSTKQSKIIINSATNWGFGYQWSADAEL